MSRPDANGVLSFQQLNKALSEGVITPMEPIVNGQIQPASIDLRLGGRAYRLVSSFLPEDSDVMEKLHTRDEYGSDLVMYDMDITEGGILERGGVYLIPLLERLDLPEGVEGKSNPKSTTGRLDIFTRIITDKNPLFDVVAAGYTGGLYLEVMPRSFTIKVKKGMSLVQLRLKQGDCTLGDSEIHSLHEEVGLLCLDDAADEPGKGLKPFVRNGLFMSVNLKGNGDRIIGYKSKKNSHVIDLTKRNYYNINDFWEIIPSSDKGTLILEPEEFYILGSVEKIRIPVDFAADMAPYEAGSGELRTHYAGFFDPGFGYGAAGEVNGTRAVLEVRAHDVPFMIAHGQTFCKLFFERMQQTPDEVYGPKIGSSYQYQGITLSKQFQIDK